MLTFGSVPGCDGDDLSALFGVKPDVIECGENNEYWIQVRRSTQKVEFISKQTGATVMRADPTAKDLPVTPAQLGAILAAIKL